MANGRDLEGRGASKIQHAFSADAGARVRARALFGAPSRLTLALLIGAGAAVFALPAIAANRDVANSSQLIDALNTAAPGDTITFTQNITLAAAMPVLTKNLTINGGGFELNGANTYQGFAVLSGTVAINNLKINNAVAQGGRGGDSARTFPTRREGGGGGGGAGLGGGLFVGASAAVTVTNVSFGSDKAIGGQGGQTFPPSVLTPGGGGGGGMFGSGEAAKANGYGGFGGAGGGGDGGTVDTLGPTAGGFGGGGGGGAYTGGQAGQTGGFGGGGGGTGNYTDYPPAGKGGWGGSDGNYVVGGSGAGLGGAVFVQQGGSLTLGGTLGVAGNSAIGGLGQNVNGGTTKNGLGAGAGLFLQGNGSLVFNPGAGQVQVVNDTIADQNGVPLDAGGNRVGPGGSWSLVKNGEGTTILFGSTQAYSGGITINGGVLQGNTFTLLGNIEDNASLVFDQYVSGTFAGAISGSGSLTKTNNADLTLTGANTYSGGTTISSGVYNSGGVLRFTTDSNLGAAGKPITFTDAGGEIGTTTATAAGATINRPINILGSNGGIDVALNPIIWSGPISGPGSFSKTGPGDLTLTGANAYAGGTVVTGGALVITSDAQLGTAGSQLSLQNGASLRTTPATIANTVFNRPVNLVGSGAIDVALDPITWSGVISGSGQLVKKGTGVLELTGANTYSGGTSVTNGVVGALGRPAWGAERRRDPRRRHVPRVPILWQCAAVQFGRIRTDRDRSFVGRGPEWRDLRRHAHQARPRNALSQRRQHLCHHRDHGRRGAW